jgi:hypothetical protein
MRSAVLVALLVTTAALFAGCSGKDEDDHTYTCANGTTLDLEKFPDHHNSTFNAASHCTASHTNSTSLPPNKLPILTLKISDGTNATNVTLLNGNLTFDATGSTDPDGQVTGIAVTIQDSNTTRTAALYDPAKKTFKTATFKFDRPGVVNVTVAMVDDRAGFTVNQTKVYVNHQQNGLSPGTIQIPSSTVNDNPCNPTPADPLLNADLYKRQSITVVQTATYITATVVSGDVTIGLCSPNTDDERYGHLISSVATDAIISNDGEALPPPPGITSYGIGIVANDASQTAVIDVVVHYDPRPAA